MATAATVSQPLTTNQKRGFLAAWGGWALDGTDSFIYALAVGTILVGLILLPFSRDTTGQPLPS